MATEFPEFVDVPDPDAPGPGAELVDAGFLNALTGAVNALEENPLADVDVTGAAPGRAVAVTQVSPLSYGLIDLRAVRPQTIALLGDSITNQNQAANTGNPYFSATGYFTWANVLLDQRFRQTYDATGTGVGSFDEFGESGKTVAQLLSENYAASWAASGATWGVVHGGTNDLASRTAAQIATDLLTIWRMGTAAGIRVVATTVLPRDNGDAEPATSDKVRAVNKLIRAHALAEPGVILCDWYALMVDPATGRANLDYLADGVHPDAAGASRMGRALADVLRPFTYDSGWWSPNDLGDVDELSPNPFCVGAASGLATNVTAYTLGAGVYTAAKVPRTDGIPGEWQQVTVTAAPGNADGVQLQLQNTAVGTKWNIGDTVQGLVEFETDAANWRCRHLSCAIDVFNGISAVIGLRMSSAERTAMTTDLHRPVRGVIATPPIVVAAGATRLQLNIHFTGTGTLRLGRNSIRRLAAI